MKIYKLPKILAILTTLVGLIDFILYFFTFNKVYMIIGVYFVLITFPLGLLVLGVCIFLGVKSTNRQIKGNYRLGSILIIIGFVLGFLTIHTYFEINKYSRLTIQNDSGTKLKGIQLTSLNDTMIIKELKEIKTDRYKKVYLNKFENHNWKMEYIINEQIVIDTINYFRYFRSATNDKIMVVENGLIDEMYETLICKELETVK